jgi:hypothetical protein
MSGTFNMDRWALLQHLAQAERHIAEGVVHLARQRALIAALDRAGHDSEEARAILDTLMETQIIHEQDHERLLRLVSQPEAAQPRPKTYWPDSISQEDAQRRARLWEMEQRAIELLRHPAPSTFLGR